MATQVYHRRRRLTNSSSSSSPISKLGDDLLLELLIRLTDPRSAVRCKPACKRWNSLLSAPYFSRRFLSHHLTSAAGESEPLTPSELRELISSFLPLPRHAGSKFSVLDSVRDLLLLGFPQGKNGDELHTTYLVCNPFTKQWVALPLAPKESARRSSIVKLVCQPCSNPHALDLAGDGGALFPCHFVYRRFRVVRMYKLWESANTVPVEVFCSRSGEWTKLVLPVREDLRCSLGNGGRVASLDDKLYWFNEKRAVVKLDPFCLDHSTLPTLMPGPPQFSGYLFHHDTSHGPWVSNGALHVIRSEWTGRLSVWRLEDDQKGRKGWRKLYEAISFENLRCIGVSCEAEALGWRLDGVMGLHPERSEVLFLRCHHYHTQRYVILSCDLGKMELEFLRDQDKKSECFAYQDEEVLPSKATFWPSAIPDYEELGG